MASMTHLDATHKEEGSNRTISSAIILDEFGGYDAIA